MSALPKDLLAAFEALPIFPLQQVVLFPGMLLPLHVFEPRYVAMVRDVLGAHRCIAMALVSERSADMNGAPNFRPVAGVGSIMEHVELPGDRLHILLRGRARVRLEELPFTPPYRRARATLITTQQDRVGDTAIAALHHVAGAFARLIKRRDSDFDLQLPKDADPAAIADALTHQLVLDSAMRQTILESTDATERIG
ncbi:MAG: LON peptidase substrate-binding domain-containing protein, partial [Polyangiaceae bacterium]